MTICETGKVFFDWGGINYQQFFFVRSGDQPIIEMSAPLTLRDSCPPRLLYDF